MTILRTASSVLAHWNEVAERGLGRLRLILSGGQVSNAGVDLLYRRSHSMRSAPSGSLRALFFWIAEISST